MDGLHVGQKQITKVSIGHWVCQSQDKFLPAEKSQPLILEGFKGLDLFLWKYKGRWYVFEAASGHKMASADLPEQVQEIVESMLKDSGLRGMMDQIADWIIRFGLSPRYTGWTPEDRPTQLQPQDKKVGCPPLKPAQRDLADKQALTKTLHICTKRREK